MSASRRVAIASAIVVLTVVAGAMAWTAGHGFSARESPGTIEDFVARRLRHLAMPRVARTTSNPVPWTHAVLRDAMAHFADHCAVCHANDGSGATEIGRNLYPKSPDMRGEATQSLSDGEIFYVIHNGVRFTGMPAWGDGSPQSDTESWKLVHFIRYLPRLSDEEIRQMESLNPRSPAAIREEMEMERFLEGDAAPPSATPHKH